MCCFLHIGVRNQSCLSTSIQNCKDTKAHSVAICFTTYFKNRKHRFCYGRICKIGCPVINFNFQNLKFKLLSFLFWCQKKVLENKNNFVSKARLCKSIRTIITSVESRLKKNRNREKGNLFLIYSHHIMPHRSLTTLTAVGPFKGNASHKLSDRYVSFERTNSNVWESQP
jgi:hypothetical protein